MTKKRDDNANLVGKKKRLRRTPGVTIKTINQRVYPWCDDVERHVDGLTYSPDVLKKAKKFATRYRQEQEAGCGGKEDEEPPCCSCRNKVIWFCSVTGFECRQFKTYCCHQ